MQKKSQDSIDNELEVFDSDLLLLLNKEYNYPEKVEFSRNIIPSKTKWVKIFTT